MEFELIKLETNEKMENYINQYKINISKISIGRANPEILSSIKVIYYENLTPLNEIASISIPEPTQLLIKPFDISINKDIANVINNSNISIQAVEEGNKVRMTFPPLTTETRKELVKSLSNYTEQSKVQIRLVRQDINKKIKNANLSEDLERDYLNEIQEITNKYILKIDELTKLKDLMTI
jgi:ribosome recycling factor